MLHMFGVVSPRECKTTINTMLALIVTLFNRSNLLVVILAPIILYVNMHNQTH